MRRAIVLWLLSFPCWAGQANLNWAHPQSRVDGSAYTNPAGYRIWYRCGTQQQSLLAEVPHTQSTYQHTAPDGETCHWALSAYDTNGLESAKSNEASKTFPSAPVANPNAPVLIDITWAPVPQMAASLVQDQQGTQVQNETTCTATYDSTPTQGNLLVAVFFTRSTGGFTAPSGWTLDVESVNTTEDDRIQIYSKTAGASESTAVTFTGLASSSSGGSSLSIQEWSGMAASSQLDKTASTGRTSGTSISSGTTATLAQADEVAIAGVGLRSSSIAVSANNSFTVLNSPSTTANAANQVTDAYRILSATTGITTTFSWSGTIVAVAAIATYKVDVVAGGGFGASKLPLQGIGR